MNVRIVNAGPLSADPNPNSSGDVSVIRGELDLSVLLAGFSLSSVEEIQQQLDDLTHVGGLLVPGYQRELIRGEKQRRLQAHLKKGGRVPSIELGVRGKDLHQRAGNVVEITDPTYIIDGLQRCMAYQALCIVNMVNAELNRRNGCKEGDEGYQPIYALQGLGVTIYVNTTENYEEELFDIFNFTQTKVSANVRLANLVGRNAMVTALHSMVSEPDFVLFERIQWTQNRRTGNLVTARSLLVTAASLHGLGASDIEDMIRRLQKVMDTIGRDQFINNLARFFTLLNELWPYTEVNDPRGTPQVSEQFLKGFALFLSGYQNFWRGEEGEELVVTARDRAKLQKLKLDQPIKDAIGAASGAKQVVKWLELLLTNRGRNLDALSPRTTKGTTPTA